MQITVSNCTSFSASDLPTGMLEQVMARLTFQNPTFGENEKRGYSNWNIPQFIRCYELTGDRLTCPGALLNSSLWFSGRPVFPAR